ncbi:DEAD/DEAH box helicase [Myxococcota bacterium]|nr:DEAD/DEAH box helicase [Myxococcota bacterium]
MAAESSEGSAGFEALGLEPGLVRVLDALGYEEPTPIQVRAIPVLLAGRDVVGSAATGTGKTAAFALPLIQRIAGAKGGGRGVRGLVLVPTRELAIQVAEAIHSYGRAQGVKVLPVYGGQPIERQLRELHRGVDVVVGTPGRLLDHVRRATLALSGVETVVLDEADEMLDMGFVEDIEAILDQMSAERQTALFSATFPRRVEALARRYLREPERVSVETRPMEAPLVRQVAYLVPRPHKLEALGRVLDLEAPTSALVFCRTRVEVDQLAQALTARGYHPEALHGGLNQAQRDRVMGRFRDGTADLLIATDVAARGLDVEQISHVVNFDVPQSPEVYVHRVGRTGRAGREGTAITMVEPREHRLIQAIERLIRRAIEPARIPTLADLRARRQEQVRTALHDALVSGRTEGFRGAVDRLAEQWDPLDIAAAALRLLAESMPAGAWEQEGEDELPGWAPRERRSMVEGGGHAEAEVPRGARPPFPEPARGEGWARLQLGLGRQQGIRPSDVVGAIAGEAGIPGRAVGAIQIGELSTFVEVPESAVETVIGALSRAMLRGHRVRVRRALPYPAERPPREGGAAPPRRERPGPRRG